MTRGRITPEQEALWHDFKTHRGPWLAGLSRARDASLTEADRLYWQHEYDALKRLLDTFDDLVQAG